MAKDLSESVVIRLDKPVVLNLKSVDGTATEEIIDMLHMREPDVSDMLTMDKHVSSGNRVAGMVAMIASACDVSETVIKKVKMSDFKKLQDALGNFMGGGLEIGEIS